MDEEEAQMKQILSTMAGTVIDVLATEGSTIQPGEDVVILESMKMEIPVSAEVGGTVTSVKIQAGDFVNEGDVLLELE